MTNRPDLEETQDMPRPRPRSLRATTRMFRATTRMIAGLRKAVTSPFTLPPSIWHDDVTGKLPADAVTPHALPWDENDVEADGMAPGVPRPGDMSTGVTHGGTRPGRKRNMVVIGQYLLEYGRWRGVLALLLLLGAIHLPALLAPAASGITFDTPPFYLRPAAGLHGSLIHLAVAGGMVAVLVLPMLARGLLLMALGLAPVVLYAGIAIAGVPALPEPLAMLRDHLVTALPAWVGLSGGLVALQSFPDHRVIRNCVIVSASVLLVATLFLWGSHWTNPVCAITGVLVVLMAGAALVVATRANPWLTVGLVKVGWLYVFTLPALYYLWMHQLPELTGLGAAERAQVIHGMAYSGAAFLMATLGVADTLHAMAWRREVRESLGSEALGLDPAGEAFTERFLAFAADSGRFTPDELAFLHRSLTRELRDGPGAG